MRLPDSLRRFAYRIVGREPSVEDERLVALFRNRAELKKELTALDDERHRLLDRLKLQEGSTMRVEEQMSALEQYLGRPDEGYKSLAYFQLKTLWRTAARRLEQFGSELSRQQKDRERKAQVTAHDRDKRERMSAIERELVEARVLAEQLQAEQKLATQRLEQLVGFWNHFRRRKLVTVIETRRQRIESVLTQATDLTDSLHGIASEPPPLFEGISVEGRRAINLAVIGYAEMLHDRLAAGNLAELSRQSMLKRVYDASYGSPAECQALMQQASRAAAEIERLTDDLADIKARADRLRRTAAYRSDSDVLPIADSITSAATSGGTHRAPPNMLLDEYWDIYKAVVR
jgi:predicted  nucleic acid-binding Zn-ribbon protein